MVTDEREGAPIKILAELGFGWLAAEIVVFCCCYCLFFCFFIFVFSKTFPRGHTYIVLMIRRLMKVFT